MSWCYAFKIWVINFKFLGLIFYFNVIYTHFLKIKQYKVKVLTSSTHFSSPLLLYYIPLPISKNYTVKYFVYILLEHSVCMYI